jgi:cation diffusion facilitator CzcD-associated flavoprotein CzcO
MLARQVPDAALRARLTPDYPVGCKRILLSSDYLAAFARTNVDLVTEGIARVTASAVETTGGRLIDADLIIYGTGFAASRFLAPMRVTGRGGITLDAAWQDGASAYLGMTVPGFPNFFMLYGPNTNLGHNSIIYMLESQFAHVLRCLGALRARKAGVVEVEAAPYRLPQLVPGRAGPQHGQLAGLFTDLPLAGDAFDAVRLPLHGSRGLLQGSCWRRIAC